MNNIKNKILAVIGVIFLILGVLLLFLPGPGILLILIGLGFLGSHYQWIKGLEEKMKRKIKRGK